MNANTMCMSVLMLCLTVDLFALMADEQRVGPSIRSDTSRRNRSTIIAAKEPTRLQRWWT